MEISFEEFLSWWLKHEAVSKGKARRRWRAAGTAVLSSFAVANREEAKKHRRQDQVHSSSESDDDVDGGGPGPGPDDDAENHGMGEGGNVGKQVASRIAGVEQLVLSATQRIDHVDNKVAQLDETIAQLQQTLGSKMDSIMAVFFYNRQAVEIRLCCPHRLLLTWTLKIRAQCMALRRLMVLWLGSPRGCLSRWTDERRRHNRNQHTHQYPPQRQRPPPHHL